jgi:glycosyltransferase involved in cell wall biosynthesis
LNFPQRCPRFGFLCKVNVLILHQHFNTPQSGGALRSYFLAKAAVEQKWKVSVITGTSEKNYQINDLDGISVHEVPVRYSNYFGFWKRVLSFLHYIRWCIALSKKFKDVDICYAISTPLTVGLAARWFRWRYNIPYIFEVGDLWPDAPIELDVITNPFLKKLLLSMEKKIYHQAQRVVALSPAIQTAIEKKTPEVKVHMIPNMADTDFFRPESKSQELEKQFGVAGKLVISYFGAMGFANGLEYLLYAAKACEQAKLPVHFILAGDGVERKNLESQASKLCLPNLSFQSFRNREGIRELMNITDIVFVSYRFAPILETGSPNKFFDGLAAGKMIMLNFGGWLRTEIEKNGCGVFVHPTEPTEVQSQLKRLLNEGNLSDYQKNSRSLAEKSYSRNGLTQQWLSILKS